MITYKIQLYFAVVLINHVDLLRAVFFCVRSKWMVLIIFTLDFQFLCGFNRNQQGDLAVLLIDICGRVAKLYF